MNTFEFTNKTLSSNYTTEMTSKGWFHLKFSTQVKTVWQSNHINMNILSTQTKSFTLEAVSDCISNICSTRDIKCLIARGIGTASKL